MALNEAAISAATAVAVMEDRAWNWQTGGQASRRLGQAVTPEFFQVFDASPAVWWPSLRASRIDPQTALRHE